MSEGIMKRKNKWRGRRKGVRLKGEKKEGISEGLKELEMKEERRRRRKEGSWRGRKRTKQKEEGKSW